MFFLIFLVYTFSFHSNLNLFQKSCALFQPSETVFFRSRSQELHWGRLVRAAASLRGGLRDSSRWWGRTGGKGFGFLFLSLRFKKKKITSADFASPDSSFPLKKNLLIKETLQLLDESKPNSAGLTGVCPFCLFQTTYFSNFKQVYTAGYATSLISLITAIFVFTVFR